MAPLIYLDTHVVAWMFAGRTDLIPEKARALLDQHDLLISPAVKLELQYLFEIRRTAEPAKTVLEALSREVGECLTKRHVREVETFGKRHDGQQLARCEVSAEDRTADDVGRDLSLRAVRGEVLGRRVLCRCRRGADRLPRHLL